jgi:hypothetical protein
MAIAALLLALVVLPLILAHDSARDKRRRGDWFAPVLPLLEAYRVTQDGKGWPVLTGRYRGRDVRLEPVLDDMAWRKLPSLWLKATLLSPNPSRGTLGFLVRARGGEFYSPTAELQHRLPLPSGWPVDAMLCTDDPATAPLELDMSAFDDPRMKELVITPKGVRLVYQAAQGNRADYLVLRQARFAERHADPALVRALLDHVLDIAASADAGTPARAAA